MESSAGDLPHVGKIKNEFFLNPFLAGDREEHANLFHDRLKSNSHVNRFLLNTDWVGEGERYRDINLADTMGILDSVPRGGLKDYMISEGTGLPVPPSVRAIDSILMHPAKPHSMTNLRDSKRRWTSSVPISSTNSPVCIRKSKRCVRSKVVEIGGHSSTVRAADS